MKTIEAAITMPLASAPAKVLQVGVGATRGQ